MSEQTIETVTKSYIAIEYMGKNVKKEIVVPGLVRAGNAYLVRCSESGEYTYCNEERLAKLTTKYGSIENVGLKYVGRNGKQTLKKAAAAAKAAAAPAVAPAVEVAATATAESPVVVTEPVTTIDEVVENVGKRKGKKNPAPVVENAEAV